jgi:hypothetical protein
MELEIMQNRWIAHELKLFCGVVWTKVLLEWDAMDAHIQ